MTTLYTKDSTDNIRFWTILTEGSDIVQKSGVVGTDNPVEHRKTAKAKNVGRANETTPEEQAISEMESKIKAKKRKGYFDTKKEAEITEVIEPMLAKSYGNHAKKVVWDDEKKPVYVQPKLDGMRCLAIIRKDKITLMSRGGKEITTLDHIKASLDPIKSDMVLDGELYAHGKSFQENMKLIKKYREGKTEEVTYHIYDTISDADYSYRYGVIQRVGKKLDSANIKIIKSRLVTSEADLRNFHAEFLAEGYEGTMIRHNTSGYKIGGRSADLLKYKDFLDEAFEVIDVVPADARPEHGIVVCSIEDLIFRAPLKGSHDEREALLKNKEDFIGQKAEIRFFERTDAGIPRFPVCVGFRLDK